MKTSVIIISAILTFSVFFPFLYFIYNGTKTTSSTKKHINSLLKDNGIVYGLKDFWRKNFMGISIDNRILTFIHSDKDNSITKNINISDLKQCNVVKHYSKDNDKVVRLKNAGLEFIFKTPINPNYVITFFNIDDDLSEDFELQRIEKWHKQILDAIALHLNLKLAS